MIHASLFSGIGGPEVAEAMLGWENAFHCEINPFGRAVLEYWFPNSKSYGDITKTDFREWRGRIDVLTGGFPCQPFSYAGKRGGAEDSRYLWPEFLRVIEEVRPTWVIGENVSGITTMVEEGVLAEMGCDSSLFGESDGIHRYEYRQPFTIERICRDLERVGYEVQPMLIPAASVNAPHRRDRVFIIAHTDRNDDVRASGEDERKGREEQVSERHEVQLPGFANHVRPEDVESDNGKRVVSDTFGIGWDEGRDDDGELAETQQAKCRKSQFIGTDSAFGWWRDFPVQPPVYRGNDGLPFDVDNLSISPTEWATESLKAYGNAIVPQVMYRIFEAIQNLELTKD